MALSDLQNGVNLPQDLVYQIGWLVTILQALGGVIIIYIIFNIVNTIINRKRLKQIDEINAHLEQIEKTLKGKR